jgi:putative transposase
VHYQPRIEQRDEPPLRAVRELAALYPRYGFLRIQAFLERLGHVMSADKAWRLWEKAGLQVPKKRPRKRVAASRPRPQAPIGANEVWAYDFVYDACANGQQIKCLSMEWFRCRAEARAEIEECAGTTTRCGPTQAWGT